MSEKRYSEEDAQGLCLHRALSAVDCPEASFGSASDQRVTLNTRKPVLEYVPVFAGISGGHAALHVHLRRDLVLATCACVRRSPCEVWEVRSCSGKSGSNTHVSLPSGMAKYLEHHAGHANAF